jgi:hypothetical protein
MAWVRVGHGRDRLVNLEGFVHIHIIPCDDDEGGSWAVEAQLRDRTSERLLEGPQADCQALLDEVAQAVWAIEVGAGAEGRARGRAAGSGEGPTPIA